MENPMVGDGLVVRFRGEWVRGVVEWTDGRDFIATLADQTRVRLKVTSHLSVNQKGWDLDRVAKMRIANH